MEVKRGVSLAGLQSAISRILPSIELIFKQAHFALTLTCTTDGHPENDPHTHGYAVDCRIHGLPLQDQSALRFALEDFLGPRYTVLLEGSGTPQEHIHIQLRRDLWPVLVAEAKAAKEQST